MTDYDISYTVDEGFRVMLSDLEIKHSERSVVSSRQLEIETYLSQYIGTFVTTIPGAYTRKTMIAPLNGNIIDMLFLLKQEHSDKFQPSELVDKLYVTLRDPYPHVKKSADGRGVVVGFPECTFKIMPGFTLNEAGYLVPELNGGYWIRSDPDKYQQQLEQADRENKGLLLPVIKMLKCWNRTIDNIFHGYYLELIAMSVLNEVPVTSHVSAIRRILSKSKKQVVYRAEDPAVKNELVDGLRDVSMVVQAMLHFQNAYDASTIALQHEMDGNVAGAYHEWEKIFPGYFPTPVSMVIHKLKDSGIEGIEALQIMRDHMQN